MQNNVIRESKTDKGHVTQDFKVFHESKTKDQIVHTPK
jgi:hypothetical protein